MLVRLYVEALLVDAEWADQVWELWHAGLVPDELAEVAPVRAITEVSARC